VSLHEWPYADQHLAYLAPATDDSFFIELLGDGQPRRSYRKHAIEFIEARNRRPEPLDSRRMGNPSSYLRTLCCFLMFLFSWDCIGHNRVRR
jgi:hypothetical protein